MERRMGGGTTGRGALHHRDRRRAAPSSQTAIGVVPQPVALPRSLRGRYLHRLSVHRGKLRSLDCRGGLVMPWILRGLRDGVVTTHYPQRRDTYADEFRGAVDLHEPMMD